MLGPNIVEVAFMSEFFWQKTFGDNVYRFFGFEPETVFKKTKSVVCSVVQINIFVIRNELYLLKSSLVGDSPTIQHVLFLLRNGKQR